MSNLMSSRRFGAASSAALSMGAVAAVVALAACAEPEPKYSSTDQFAILLLPTAANFNSVQVPASSATIILQVYASALSNDKITSITESCPDFSLDLSTFTPGQPVYRVCIDNGGGIPRLLPCIEYETADYQFTAMFTPSITGVQNCVVDVQMAFSGLRQFSLTGTGTAPPKLIAVTPASLDLGELRNNTVGTRNVTISNAGGAALAVTSVSVSGPPFSIGTGGASSYALAIGQAVNVPIDCTAINGDQAGTLTVVSDDPANGTISVPLRCKGVDSQLDVTPSPAVFASRTGESQSVTVDIRNLSNFPITVQQRAVLGTAFTLESGPAAGAIIAANASVAAVIKFNGMQSGAAEGELKIVDDMGQARSVLLTAVAKPAVLSLTPDGNFGPICVGQTKTINFAALGIGAADFEFQGATTQAPFSVEISGVPRIIKGSGQSAVTFAASVAPTAAGDISGVLRLQTDIPNEPSKDIVMTATGLDGGVGASPAEVNLGATRIEEVSLPRPVSLGNCTAGPITVASVAIEGLNAGDFLVAQAPTSLIVTPTSSITWNLVMRAAAKGSRTAEFVITYDGGQQLRVPLTGEGFDTSEPAAVRGTYYACAAGGQGAGWLVIGAAAFVVSRRRRQRHN